MGFIWLGIVLIVVGILLSVVLGGVGSTLASVGWVLLIAGVILAIISALTGSRVRTAP